MCGTVEDRAKLTELSSSKAQRSQISRILVLLRPNTILFSREDTQHHTQLDPERSPANSVQSHRQLKTHNTAKNTVCLQQVQDFSNADN